MAEEDNMDTQNDDCIITHNNQNENDDDDSHINDLDNLSDEYVSADSHKNKLSIMFSREARKDIMANSEYRHCLRNLNPSQKKIVMFNRKWCKAYIRSLRDGTKPPSYKVFLNGPGGTGK